LRLNRLQSVVAQAEYGPHLHDTFLLHRMPNWRSVFFIGRRIHTLLFFNDVLGNYVAIGGHNLVEEILRITGRRRR